MKYLSTRQAAKKLGLPHSTLVNYIAMGKLPAPNSVTTGSTAVHIWSEEEIGSVRKLLPKIANGRKTRYQKQKSEVRSQKSVGSKAKSKPKSSSRRRKAKGSKQ